MASATVGAHAGGLKADLVKDDCRAATRDSRDEDVGREVLARCHAHGANACCGDEGPEPVQAVLSLMLRTYEVERTNAVDV